MSAEPSCQRCKGTRVARVSARCVDGCEWKLGELEHEGYVPGNRGIGGGGSDYVQFLYCLDCGQMQGQWPLPAEELGA